MKDILYKITGFFLSLIVVFSTLSFSVETHYCGGKAIAVSFFGNVDTCNTEDLKTDVKLVCANDTTCANDTISQTLCCVNKTVVIQGSNATKLIAGYNKVVAKIQSINFYNSIFINTSYKKDRNDNYQTYIPPILDYNYQVIFQSFLI